MRNDGTHIPAESETNGNQIYRWFLYLKGHWYTWWNKKRFREVGSHFYAPGPIHVVNGKQIKLGDHVFLGQGCQLYAYPKGNIRIGDYSSIDRFVEIRGGRMIDIQDHVRIVKGATLKAPENADLVIGSRSVISQGCILDGGIKVGQDVTFGPNVFVNDEDHGFLDTSIPINQQEGIVGTTVIEDDVWIANGVTILKNVTIGKGSVIGAGAVVNRSVPAYSINVGVPSKSIKSRTN
ncbi:acyltransferase [Paenibacillus sp. FSL H8-0034]|uniref:acyltransferase n=1 Tax=Paenibacillus sp. FSL H8-0034 TaxID=2954671 RepID=UPI0030F5DCFB